MDDPARDPDAARIATTPAAPPAPERRAPDVRAGRRAALLSAGAWLLVWLATADAFGPTWDAASIEYPLGERALGYVLGRPTADGPSSRPGTYAEHLVASKPPGPSRAPHPEFPVPIATHTTWPLMPILSAASCEVFWTRLGLLKPFVAHHLPIALSAALLAALLARAAGRRFGLWGGVAAAALLLTAPRFAADAYNNLKDVPEACFYFAAAMLFLRAFEGGPGRWVVAGAVGGVALAQKANALLLGPHVLVAFVVLRVAAWRAAAKPRWSWLGVVLGLVAAAATYLAFSPQYWDDPWPALKAHYEHVLTTGNTAFRVGDGAREVSFEAVLTALFTTPPALLAAALLGLFNPRLEGRLRLFLLIGALLPPARTLLPGMVNFDGVRHFWEFHPFLCLLGAGGVDLFARGFGLLLRRVPSGPALAGAATTLLCFGPTAFDLAAYMPDGTTYYNAFCGGLKGARQRSNDYEATDYWANGYWRALDWLNANAAPGARVIVPLAPKVAQCGASVKLRADLVLNPPDGRPLGAPTYVMYVTRDNWYRKFVWEMDQFHAPAYVREVGGAPILKIHAFKAGADGDAAVLQWARQELGERAFNRMMTWATSDRDPSVNARRVATVNEIIRRPVPTAERVQALRAFLPPNFDADLDAFFAAYWRY